MKNINMMECIIQYDSSVVLFGLAVFFMLWIFLREKRNLPPGPIPLPIVGNFFMLNGADVLTVFRNLRLEYGDLYTLKIGSSNSVVVNGYNTLKELLIKNGDKTSDRPDIFLIRAFTRNKGLGGSSGMLWKIHRAFASTTLRSFGVGKRSIEGRIMEEVDAFLKEIDSLTTKPVNLDGLIQASISNIICSIAFGQRFAYTDKRFLKLLELLHENFRLLGPSAILNAFPILQYLPGDPFKAKLIVKNVEIIRNFLDEIIKEHMESYDEDNIKDYVSAYLKEMKSKRCTFTECQLTTSIFELFVVGTETTATTLRWALLYFLHHPNVQHKMKHELDNVVGTSRSPSLNDRTLLPYCEAVITEVLRCGNINPIALQHSCSDHVSVQGFCIPKGTMIIPNLDSVHSDSNIFDNPGEFRPERFIDDHGNLHGHDMVVAFSIGRRNCLGESLARSELFLYLTSIIQRFQIMPVDRNKLPRLEGILGVTRMPHPYELCILKRN